MRGFTLYEALVSLALAAIVLAVSGQILAGYSRMTRQTQTRAAAREAAAQALSSLSRELRAAVEWTSPAPGESASEVRWTRYSRSAEDWIARAEPDWDYRAAGVPVAGRVRLQGNQLLWDGDLLAERVTSFQITRVGGDRLNLTLEVLDDQRHLKLTGSVMKAILP